MTTIKLKRSDVPGKVPLSEDLELGEIALNVADAAVFMKTTYQDDPVRVNPQVRPTARITRHWIDSVNSYDLIEVKGVNAGKYLHQSTNPEEGQLGVFRRVPMKNLAASRNVSIAVNSQAFRNADGTAGWNNELLVPNGLMIADGQLITDWDAGTNLERTQALVMYEDGKLGPAYRDQDTGAGLIANGATWAISWGAFCVLDGEGVPNLNSGYMGDVASARTVIGQRPNGDIVIAVFEGVTGVSGLTPDEVAPIMLSHNCEIAFITDGGGSSQIWWNSYYAHGSSDLDSPRTLPFAMVVDAVTENEYDSGEVPIDPAAWMTGPIQNTAPMLSLRQTGALINVRFNFQGFEDAGTMVRISPRYLPHDSSEARGILNGLGGRMIGVNMGGGTNLGNLYLNRVGIPNYSDPTGLGGVLTWTQRG